MLLELFRKHAVQPRRAATQRLLDRARTHGELAPDADLNALASALLGALYADHLASRATDEDWAERTPARPAGADRTAALPSRFSRGAHARRDDLRYSSEMRNGEHRP